MCVPAEILMEGDSALPGESGLGSRMTSVTWTGVLVGGQMIVMGPVFTLMSRLERFCKSTTECKLNRPWVPGSNMGM